MTLSMVKRRTAAMKRSFLGPLVLVQPTRPRAMPVPTGVGMHLIVARPVVGARGTARVTALVVRHVGERGALLEQAVLGFGRHLDMIPR